MPKAYVEPDRATLARIEREQRLLAGLWDKTAAEPYWRGTFLPPADGSPGSAFGLRRFFNGEPRSPHAGIDFRAPEGAPVRASNRGRVVLASGLFFTGNTVVIDHGCGLFTLYVHLSEFGVRQGAWVDRGQEIGKVGMTGRATGPHLHFAVRLGDARIDPAALVVARPGCGARRRIMKFEERLNDLESIVEKLEAAELPLEDALALFEKGIGLVRALTAQLDEVERKLEVLTRNAAGDPELREMEEPKRGD